MYTEENLFQLTHSEQHQQELQATRLALEKEIFVKKNSIIIDRERCLRFALSHLSSL
jgi:hypothetical protein